MYSLPVSSVHGILQARVLQWVAISFSKNTGVGCISFSRGSSPPRDRTPVSCIAGRFFPRLPGVTSAAIYNQRRGRGEIGSRVGMRTWKIYINNVIFKDWSNQISRNDIFWLLFVVESLSCIQLYCDPMDCSPPGFSVHRISQARILEEIAISFSRGSSWPRDQTLISRAGMWILHHWATREAL